MTSNPTKILLLTTMVSGALVSVSSNSWFSAWMGLEVNLMSFIPLMSNIKNMYNTEASLKYFIVQVLASATLMFAVTMKSTMEGLFTHMETYSTSTLICTPLLMKSGAAPLHWWFPGVMEGLSWENCVWLMTIQKAAPLMLISYSIENNLFITSIIASSVVIGAIGGLNQTSMRKIMTYSSINHTGWMLMAMITGESMWVMYFITYSLLVTTVVTTIKLSKMSFINQTMMTNKESSIMKFMMFSCLLSLGGLPPFTGFMPKWFVIQGMATSNLAPMAVLMVTMSLITLYYYLKICYSSFLILSTEPKWNFQSQKPLTINYIMALTLSTISLTGTLLCTTLTNVM
uniref:NADH-ubiquinone oxidoreductase chain 2 n=1 Tax=Rhinotermes hispidus TaxID=280684 RepID=A0A3G1DJF9_9NEOP|nr:NADH dehydrogenase subunit 2 [Rhinotermes hispidus]AMX23106.1 NADH dehydrogenase subunit 2 [Rhinotermes hispidus]